MAIVLPLAVFLILWRTARFRGDSSREALLRAAVYVAALLILLTELLSVFYLVNRAGLICAWSIVLAGAILLAFRARKRNTLPVTDPRRSVFHLPPRFDFLERLLATEILVFLAIVGLIAIIVPPNSWDVMEHHMPRVLFWVSNHTLRIFPTPDYTQVMQGTGAESITLNTYLLWGSDRFANMVEFFSLVGSAVAVTLIAAKFGASRAGQLLAALFVVTLPELILESSGSMSTGVAGFWIVSACFFLLRAGSSLSRSDVVAAALAAGLALLTKGITAVYLPAVMLGCMLFRPPGARMWLLKRLPLFVALLAIINAGQFVRAWQVTGTPFDEPFPAGGPRVSFATEHITPAAIAANVLRQVTLELGTPSTWVNSHTEAFIRRLILRLGEDPDDPRASWSAFPFYMDHPKRLETEAGNPNHFVLVAASFLLLPLISIGQRDRRLVWYASGIVVAFLVFSAVIRWQPWGSRFHMPLFILAAAVVGIAAERLLARRWLLVGLSTFLVVVALPYLLSNRTRSILHTKGFPTIFQPRTVLYFADQHTDDAPVVLSMAETIRKSGCGRVALDAYLPVAEPQIAMSPPSFFIYPMLSQLGIDGRIHFVRYIHVQNPTRNFAPASPAPPDCAIVCLSCRLSSGQKSDSAMGPTQVFANDELIFPPLTH